MSERDDDILDFDFFEEPATAEQQPTQRVRMPRRRPAGPGGPGGGAGGPRTPGLGGPGNFAPLARLIVLIAFAIAIVIGLVFWVQSCQGAQKKNAYRDYVENVSEIAQTSTQIGRDLTDALTTPGQRTAGLRTALTALAEREQQDIDEAEQIDPPGALREEHQALIQALQFRVSGLQGLAATLRAKTTGRTASVLAEQSERFVASDVVWDDLFRTKAQTELARQDVSGVEPPDSNFVVDPALTTADAWSRVLQRLAGASTGGNAGGGLHGSALEYVEALSGGQSVGQGQRLTAGSENTVTATTDLAFAVGIKDSGESQEVGIEVTLTIEKPGAPIVKTATIQVIDPGETKNVIFRNLGQVPFAAKTNLRVDVAPVPGEANTDNNSATYPVIFSLG